MDLLELAHSVGKYCIGMEGNVSQRLPLMECLKIKASGTKLSDLTEDELITVLLSDGRQYDNEKLKPSLETDFHRVIYELCPEVNFIAHTHPINTLAILCGGETFIDLFARKRLYPEQVIFNGATSCVVNYVHPGEELSIHIKLYINEYIEKNNNFPKLILLKNHGIIACGRNASECVAITDTCEKAAEVYLKVMKHGSGRFLTDSSVVKLLEDEKEKYRMSLCK